MNDDASETALSLYVSPPTVSTFEYLLSVCGFLKFIPAVYDALGKCMFVMLDLYVGGPYPKLLPGVIRLPLTIPEESFVYEGVCWPELLPIVCPSYLFISRSIKLI